jgi:hypothetical protein
MNFLDQIQLAADENVIQRVQQALIKSALAVAAEDAGAAKHAERRIFAERVLHEPQRWARLVVLGVVTNPAISAKSSDDDIEFTVNSMWDAYAGI